MAVFNLTWCGNPQLLQLPMALATGREVLYLRDVMPDKALVVESDPTTQKQIAGLLTRRGFRVECVDDGDRAIGRFVATLPKLVVCAEQLPGLNGVEVCQQVRKLGSRARILLLTNLSLESSQRDEFCKDVGCDTVICRPFRVGDLADALIAWGLGEETQTQHIDFGVPIEVPFSANQTATQPITEPVTEPVLLTKPKVVLLTSPKVYQSAPVHSPERAAFEPTGQQTTLAIPIPFPAKPVGPTTTTITNAVLEGEVDTIIRETTLAVGAPTPRSIEEASIDTPSAEVTASWGTLWETTDPAPLAVAEEPRLHHPVPAIDKAAPEIATALVGEVNITVVQSAGDAALVPVPSLLPSGVARFGDLAGMPLPRLLYELYVGTYFGVLRLRRGGAFRTLYFLAGVPVRVDTDQLTDSLGAMLKETGRIADDQLQRAKQHALDNGCAIGIALVETGAIHERDLLDALVVQNEQKLTNTFAWRDGVYEARDDISFASHTVLCDINPLHVIWRGVCEHYEVGPLLEFFSRQRERFVVATDLFALQAEMLAEPLEHLVAAGVLDGKTTVEEALLADAAHTVEISRALYVFLVTDMIRMLAEPGKAAPVVAKQVPITSVTLIDYAALLEASERIAREYLRTKGKDHFGALGVTPQATTQEIEAAYTHATERLEADRALAGLPPEDHKRLREISRTQNEAFATLADPNRRAVYARTLAPQAGASVPPEDEQSPAHDRRQSLFVAEEAYQEGQKLLAANKPYAARQLFLDAVEAHPAESTYRVAVAQAILAGGHAETENPRAVAFSYIDEALRLDPANLIANLEAAKLLAADGAPEQALVYLDKVLKRAPGHPLAQRLLRELTGCQ